MTLKTTNYKVVINHEEQYSIILATQKIPLGWREIGKIGPKKKCMQYIEEVWTDMKPSDKDRIMRSK